MSREIKFRVYDKTKGYYVAIRDNDCFDIRQTARVIVELTSLGHEFILEQFTGLKDKNGKEICEGDIIKLEGSDTIYTVEYGKGVYVAKYGDEPGNNICLYIYCPKNMDLYCEVIGNIHENPELLEK